MKKVRADRTAVQVKMIGDGKPEITVKYYLDPHPDAYEGMEDRYMRNPNVKILTGPPPVL